MSSNRRIFYACQAVGIGNKTGGSINKLHGVQSVGINTTFNLQQVFEIGMISIYDHIEGIADIEITLEKVLDGHPLIYLEATKYASTYKLASRVAEQCSVALSIADDQFESASGQIKSTCLMTGVFVSQVSYKSSVDGNVTESVSMIGNNKVWSTIWMSDFQNDDEPAYTGGVAKRQDVNISGSNIPTCIPSGSSFQSISVSANITRENIMELGKKTPYFKYAKFPIEITSEFEVIAKGGDNITVREDQNNLSNENIIIKFKEGTTIDLGTKNRLQSINYQGGGTDGNNATINYSFKTYNDFTVTQD